MSAIQKIQQRTKLPCSYQIPAPATGSKFDFYSVNVKFTSGQGQAADILSAGTADNCTSNQGGWFYDNPNAPTSIQLCPQTCEIISGDSRGKVDILLGCEPKGVPPPIPR